MIVIDCAQGSEQWHMARAGVATASQFSRLVTPAKLQPSKKLRAYALEIAAERLLGRPVRTLEELDEAGKWSERGSEMEAEALGWYGLETGAPVRTVGFCKSDDGLCGCSPDALVGDDGGLEIKCPRADTHLGYLVSDGAPGEYLPQIQGALFVTGRAWWDFVSYIPPESGMPPVCRRVYPDARWQEALADGMDRLRIALAEVLATAKARGAVERPPIDYTDPALFDRFEEKLAEHPMC